jgi:hypothetical protein
MSDGHADRARFTAMTEGTAEDWQIISSHFMPFAAQVGTRVLDHLRLLDGDYGGFPIDRLQHSLQTATRAHHPDLEQTVTAAVGRRTNSVTPALSRGPAAWCRRKAGPRLEAGVTGESRPG